jgi:hypothetical protein
MADAMVGADRAIAEIMNLIATDLGNARDLVNKSICDGDADVAWGAVALIERAGALADAAALKLGGRAYMEPLDAWLHSPGALQALGVLSAPQR